MKVKSESEVAQSCQTLRDPMDSMGPLSMGFSRQEYWSGVPLPSPQRVLKVEISLAEGLRPGESGQSSGSHT